ncbi:hypothetical protein VCUG_01763 [Vavraia culicis subsp. floridensis]|uniref:Uncharacterized protein n=1 Tax=Vavraia culicis (isolate floridensis) TaxID=948595 RepID=L2GTP3_VAVCU|nr:uncharacterized protein VCUG_01763 [Vavraia culicis subsp. floridensis]ELA46737.1 hypothetical protein VCUG_01763 [Vavraia culicis subsp. floridensis]
MIVLSHFLFLCTFTTCTNAPVLSVQPTERVKTDDELADEEVALIMSEAMRQTSAGNSSQYSVHGTTKPSTSKDTFEWPAYYPPESEFDMNKPPPTPGRSLYMAKPSTSKDTYDTAKPSTSKDTFEWPAYYPPESEFDMNKPPPTPGRSLYMAKPSTSKDTFEWPAYYPPESEFNMNKSPPTPGGTFYEETATKPRDVYGPIGPHKPGACDITKPSTPHQCGHVTFAATSKPYITRVPVNSQQHNTTHIKSEHAPQFNQQGVNRTHTCRKSFDLPSQQYQCTNADSPNTNKPVYKRKRT